MSVTVPPSRFHCWFDEDPWAPNDDCCPDWLPPTFSRSITMPGVCSRITHGSRADGIASRTSLLKFEPSVADLVSTKIGRASCRERVWISVVCGSLNNKKEAELASAREVAVEEVSR